MSFTGNEDHRSATGATEDATSCRPRALATTLLLVALAVLAAGCGGTPSPTSATAATVATAQIEPTTTTPASTVVTARATTTITLNSTLSSPSGKRIQQGQSPVSPSTPRSWALATSALLAQANEMRPDLLGGYEYTPEMLADQKHALAYWWGINSRRDLLRNLENLGARGHRADFDDLGTYLAWLDEAGRQEFMDEIAGDAETGNQVRVVMENYERLGPKSLLGWDFSRYICLCRWGYYIGYLSEEEAWTLIMPVAAMLQQVFTSWEDLGENYLIGREFWSLDETQRSGPRYRAVYKKLLDDPDSPWRTNAWEMDLNSGLQSN